MPVTGLTTALEMWFSTRRTYKALKCSILSGLSAQAMTLDWSWKLLFNCNVCKAKHIIL